MYKIISAGKIVALCDAPRYVTRNPDTGALVETTAEDAIGVSVAGTLYNLNGGSGIPDAPAAVVSEGLSRQLHRGPDPALHGREAV